MNRAILLTVAYDGRPFSGWALQPTARTVAGELLGAIRQIDPSVRRVTGASRTDAGVHARGQLALFLPARDVPPKGWALGLSRHLPEQIAVRRAARIADDANLAGSITAKRYRYLVLVDPARDPFWEGRALRIGGALDWSRIEREAQSAVGRHDFAAFRASADRRESTVRTIESIRISTPLGDPRLFAIDVVGNAFLYNMVRILVGTLLEVGRGRLVEGTIAAGLASRKRETLGFTAPAHGLYLEEVMHRIELFDTWP